MIKRDDRREQGMRVDYCNKREKDGEYLYVKFQIDLWNDPKYLSLISMTGRSILESSFNNLCFDFSAVPLVHSMLLGECATLIKLAADRKKTLKFRFNKDSAELVRTTRLDKLATVEEV